MDQPRGPYNSKPGTKGSLCPCAKESGSCCCHLSSIAWSPNKTCQWTIQGIFLSHTHKHTSTCSVCTEADSTTVQGEMAAPGSGGFWIPRTASESFLNYAFCFAEVEQPCTDSISKRSSVTRCPQLCVSLDTWCLATLLAAALQFLVIRASRNTPLLCCCDKRWLVKQPLMLVPFLYTTGPRQKIKRQVRDREREERAV